MAALGDIINLTSDDDAGEARNNKRKAEAERRSKRKAEAERRGEKTAKVEPASSLGKGGGQGDVIMIDCSSSDDEVEEDKTSGVASMDEVVVASGVGAVATPLAGGGGKKKARAAADEDDDDVDLKFIGHTGKSSLVDFPHSREHCAVHNFGTAVHCDNCFCMVCDKPASDCTEFASSHYAATFSSSKWRKMREEYKKNGGKAKVVGDGGKAKAVVATGGPALSCDLFLKEVQQVWPAEENAPAGMNVKTLRHYQKQDLAFMLSIERADDSDERVASWSETESHSCVQPPNPFAEYCGRHGRSAWDLYQYHEYYEPKVSKQKQRMVRGGWLADEVGMGKTVAALALILANPMPEHERTMDLDKYRAQEKCVAALKPQPRAVFP